MACENIEVRKGSESVFATSVIEELLDGNKGYASGPERGLLSALLFDGVQAYIHYALASSPKEKTRYAEAFSWVMDTGVEYAFSFNNVCEALGLNPDYVRFGLANASTSLLVEAGKSRRNF